MAFKEMKRSEKGYNFKTNFNLNFIFVVSHLSVSIFCLISALDKILFKFWDKKIKNEKLDIIKNFGFLEIGH